MEDYNSLTSNINTGHGQQLEVVKDRIIEIWGGDELEEKKVMTAWRSMGEPRDPYTVGSQTKQKRRKLQSIYIAINISVFAWRFHSNRVQRGQEKQHLGPADAS